MKKKQNPDKTTVFGSISIEVHWDMAEEVCVWLARRIERIMDDAKSRGSRVTKTISIGKPGDQYENVGK